MKIKVIHDTQFDQTWAVRLISKGEGYGVCDCVIHDKEDPLVEFFDPRYGGSDLGCFVSRYFRSTLLETPVAGLCLQGGTSPRYVGDDCMSRLLHWLKETAKLPSPLTEDEEFEELAPVNHDTSVMVGVIQGIDWHLLSKRKLALVELVHGNAVNHKQKESLEGILHLLDAMTDAAYDDGLTVNQTLEEFQQSDAAIQQASHYLKTAADMSTDQLDDWYEQRVGYRISQDDPSLIGKPEHGYAIAEMMCLHDENGEGEIYQALLGLIEKAKK